MIIKSAFQFLIVLTVVYGSSSDTITIKPNMFGNTFYFKDKQVRSRADMRYLLIWSPTAYRDFKAARPLYIAKMTSITVSATLIGFSLVQGTFAAFSNASFYWQPGAVGVGGIVLSIPLHTWHNSKISRAVDLFNRDVINKTAASSKNRP